jgi:hypothetical protein
MTKEKSKERLNEIDTFGQFISNMANSINNLQL